MFKSLFAGLLQAGRLWRLGGLLLITSILFSIPVVLPIFWLVLWSTQGRAMAQRMMAGELDFFWFADLINQRFDGLAIETTGILTLGGLLLIGLIYLLLHTLFAAGVVSIVTANDRDFRMWDFWAGCGAFFGRFFRLMLMSKIFQGVALAGFALWQAYLGRIDSRAEAFAPVARMKIAGIIVFALVLAFISMTFDYARLRTVANNRRRMLRESFRAIGFTLRHFFSTFPLYLLLATINVLLLGGLTLLRGMAPQRSGGQVLLAFLLGQLAIGLGLWCRIWFCAAQSEQLRRIVEKRRNSNRRRSRRQSVPEFNQEVEPPAGDSADRQSGESDEQFDPYATRG